MKKFFLLSTVLLLSYVTTMAQDTKLDVFPKRNMGNDLLTDMIDTSTAMGKKMLSIATKFGNISFSGYLQPQFQYIQTKGSASYNGGDYAPNSDNRFRLRRGRMRMDYTGYTAKGKPSTYFVLQFDGTERGVNVRDFWGRYYENKFELFHFSTGIMARPFGFELLYSSVNREAPERGRMSQILMNTERDLGVMFSFAPRKKESKIKWIGFDIGIYNGQGLTGTQEFDSHKDVVSKLSFKKIHIPNTPVQFSAGLSYFNGGLVSQGNTYYRYANNMMYKDSAEANIGKVMARKYYGMDAQFQIPNKKGITEFRAEYIMGQQTGTLSTTITPGTYPTTTTGSVMPLAVRSFNGAYFYYLQHLGSAQHQLVLKYDWYDPNTKVSGNAISATNNFTAADVKYNTFGGGYVYYVNPNLKLTLWYEHPVNEKSAIKGIDKDLKDDNFTCRAQFSF
ncbi:porin [Taibaiella sp. KBW10]|uniref:porin n=1 Tax=Taibaiella sp. KBW10 TaxID=2153357 RepID=UPI0018F453ED|nr:porin [Taibaiella sp. KBW10]